MKASAFFMCLRVSLCVFACVCAFFGVKILKCLQDDLRKGGCLFDLLQLKCDRYFPSMQALVAESQHWQMSSHLRKQIRTQVRSKTKMEGFFFLHNFRLHFHLHHYTHLYHYAHLYHDRHLQSSTSLLYENIFRPPPKVFVL